MDISTVQQKLERIASLLRSDARNLLTEHGLQPVQLEALHYLSISNRYSDSPMAVTEFLGQTKGTISQTLKVLEKKGLITKTRDVRDKRVIHMTVTEDGRKIIDSLFPLPILQNTDEQLSSTELSTISASLSALLRALQQANGFRSFGQCAGCIHNVKISDEDFLCNLTKESLSENDTRLICREHQPAAGVPSTG